MPPAAALHRVALALAAFLLCSAQAPESDLGRFRRLATEANAATERHDLPAARRALEQASAVYPTHPGALVSLARAQAADGHVDEAVVTLGRYAALGLTLRTWPDPRLASVAAAPGFAPVAARLAANARPVGALTVLARTPDRPVLSEAVVVRNGVLLLGSVRDAGVFRLSTSGEMTRFSPQDATAGVFGMAVDRRTGDLWVASSRTPHVRGGSVQGSAVLRLDGRTGRVLARVAAPTGVQQLGDLALGPDGAVYVSDPVGGQVYRLRRGGATLEPLFTPGAMISPQGMAVSPDGRRLVVSDYSSGMWGVDLATGAAAPLSTPPMVSLFGVDGVTGDGLTLYATQNGVSPHRILRVRLDRGWRAVRDVSVLAANLPDLDEPSGGAVVAGRLLFVARSQWSVFGDDGEPTQAAVGPVIVASVPLAPGAAP